MPIRVLQAVAWYPPFHLGGTEGYLEGLNTGLAAAGVDSAVVLPSSANIPRPYVHAGIPVEPYPEGDSGAAHADFVKILRRHIGAIYHQHSWTTGCGLPHIEAAKALGMPTVLTIHTPNPLCLRGTMLEFGRTQCDGHIDGRRCGACWAEGRGLPVPLAHGIAALPEGFARLMRRSGTRVGTALGARALGMERLAQFHAMVRAADRIVAVCQWLHDALAANGVPRDKLVFSRQGIPTAEAIAAEPPRMAGEALRLIFLGRWDPVKGIDVVVRAVRALPSEPPVELRIHAIPGGPRERAYEAQVRTFAEGDQRISFAPPIGRDQVLRTLAEHHVLVVPSLWLETGPLTVLEGQAAGLFVLGSRLGGIAELVGAADGGLLVEPGNWRAWSAAIKELAARHAAGALPAPRGPVRTMADVVADMTALYRALPEVRICMVANGKS